LYRRAGKRVLDLAIAIPALVVSAPLIAVLLIVVALDGGKPLFGHRRVGRDGRMFSCFKIRTMVPDAAERLAELLRTDPMARAEWEATQKLVDDPRITRLGRILRKTSLDELPQLWNVIRGDMSIVGPRPVVEDELRHYGRRVAAYKSVRPGLTGLWQVSGRNDVSYSTRVALDARYVRSHTLPRDLAIILLTPMIMLRPTGR